MKRRRFLAGMVTGMIALAVLSGCSGEQKSVETATQAVNAEVPKDDNVVEINFVNWSSEGSTAEAFKKMYEKYEEEHPNVKIKNTALPYNQFLEQVLIMTSGGSSPDVLQIHGSMVSTLVSSGALTPLDNLISEETQNDFFENVKEPLYYDGKLMATPWVPSPNVLYYNKTLLNQAGYTEPPKTWQEMKQMAVDISALGTTENGSKVYGFGLATKKLAGAGYCYLPWIWTYGGDLVNAQGEVTMDTPEVILALTETKELLAAEISPIGLEVNDLRNLFAQGQLGFLFDGDYGYLNFVQTSPKGEAFREEFDAAVPPENMSVYYEHNLGICEGSKNKEAATEFVEWLSGPEAMHIYNEYSTTKTPARKSVKDLEEYTTDQDIQVFLDTLEVSRAFPQKNPGFIKAMEDVAESLQRVSVGGEDPADVAKNLDEKITELYNKQ